jgi:archaellum component FlaC
MKRRVIAQKGIVEKDMTVRELAGIMTVRFDGLEKRVEKLEIAVSDLREDMMYEFRAIDERFNKVDQKFIEIDERFNKMDERFEKVDQRFNKLESKIDLVDKKLTYEFKAVSIRVECLEEKIA